MTTRTTTKDVAADTYTIPAPLVHRGIMALVTLFFGLAGYMIVWALNDREWKAQQQTAQLAFTKDLAAIRQLIDPGVLPRADERLKALERAVEQQSTDLREWGTGLRGSMTELQSSHETHRNDAALHRRYPFPLPTPNSP